MDPSPYFKLVEKAGKITGRPEFINRCESQDEPSSSSERGQKKIVEFIGRNDFLNKQLVKIFEGDFFAIFRFDRKVQNILNSHSFHLRPIQFFKSIE